MTNIVDAMLGLRRLQEMGFSDEAVRNALSARVYSSEQEMIAAVKAEHERLTAEAAASEGGES